MESLLEKSISIAKNLRKLIKYPPGHYYSPIPNLEDVSSQKETIYDKTRSLKGIDLNRNKQMELLSHFKEIYPSLFFEKKSNTGRFYYENGFFCETDAIMLYCIMLHFNPKRIIEVGSGFSSAVMLDTKEKNGSSIDLTFIEPYPERLNSILTDADGKVNLVKEKVQFVPKKVFSALEKNDILFIDSSHVAKSGSDVVHLLFEVIPELKAGTIIHVHDIFFPFEYPYNWIEGGRAWNEAHFLRAFLMDNPNYEIMMFNNYIVNEEKEWFAENMPLCLNNAGGSIWIRKIN